jgi:hypothetical protein
MKLRDIKALTPLKFSTSARDALSSIAGTEHVAHDLYSIQTSQWHVALTRTTMLVVDNKDRKKV